MAAVRFTITERQLRRVVDGAVLDALKTHPEYLTPRGRAMALNGIAKRVYGSLKGFAAQSAEGRDSVDTEAVGSLHPGLND